MQVKYREQNVPPFRKFSEGSRVDFFSYWGANELARRIKEAWAKVGVEVNPSVERAPELGSAIMNYVVRMSDLVNGLPVRREE